MKIAYGYTIEPHKVDPLVHMAGLALEHFAIAGSPGAWLVDMIPSRENEHPLELAILSFAADMRS